MIALPSSGFDRTRIIHAASKSVKSFTLRSDLTASKKAEGTISSITVFVYGSSSGTAYFANTSRTVIPSLIKISAILTKHISAMSSIYSSLRDFFRVACLFLAVSKSSVSAIESI
jgi:hypothetical protein